MPSFQSLFLTSQGSQDVTTGYSRDLALHPDNPGIIIPFYIYPSAPYDPDSEYNILIGIKNRYKHIPIYVIVNPNNGPDVTVDGNYTVAIDRLKGAGIIVLGYVYSTYATRALTTVQADVATWKTLYPAVDGIFVDETTDADSATFRLYYKTLRRYANMVGFKFVMGNPGTTIPKSYFDEECFDNVCTYETNSMPSESTLKGDYENGNMAIDYRRRSALVYNQSNSSTFVATVRMMAKYCGLIYITDSNTPWTELSAYMEPMCNTLSALGNGGGSSPINVRSFGALGDGATDDTVAIQAAINMCQGVIIPAGEYLISSGLTIPAGFAGHTISGAGCDKISGATTVIKSSATMTSLISIADNADGVVIRDLAIDGDNLGTKGIDDSSGAVSTTLESVRIQQCTEFSSLHTNWASISNCSYDNAATSTSALVIFSNCTIRNSTFSGAQIGITIYGSNNVLLGLRLVANTLYGVLIESSFTAITDNSISDSIFDHGDTTDDTVLLSLDGTSDQYIQRTTICGCHFIHKTTSNSLVGCIKLDRTRDTTIIGCTLQGEGSSSTTDRHTTYGIRSDYGIALSITGNIFDEISLNAIFLSVSSPFTITGNIFRDCGAVYATGTQGANIYLYDTSTKGLVVSNSFYVPTSTSVPYSLQGADSLLVGYSENFIEYDSTTIASFTTGSLLGSYQRSGGAPRHGRIDTVAEVVVGTDLYIGDPNTNGSWKFTPSGDNLLIQQRESGSWVTKQTISGA